MTPASSSETKRLPSASLLGKTGTGTMMPATTLMAMMANTHTLMARTARY
jgi:hypothetical protein